MPLCLEVMWSWLDNSTFGKYFLRALFTELGAKTFFITTALCCWCPWEGLREGHERIFQLGLVFTGSFLALSTRAVLDVMVSNPSFLSALFDVTSCAILLVLSVRAWLHLSRLDSRRATEGAAAASNPFADKLGDEEKAPQTWNQQAFLSTPLLSQSTGSSPDSAYGALRPPPPSADGVFAERISDKIVGHFLALLAPLVVVFCVEAEDKSELALLVMNGGTPSGLGPASAASLGFFTAIVLAVIVGFILERQLSDHRLLFAITLVFSSLSLVSLSQALMHLNAVALDQPNQLNQTVSLLALFSMTQGTIT